MRLPAVAALAILALGLTTACGVPPGPQGWAGPVPVKIDSANVILVSHKKTLFAMPAGSSNALWQFPPKDKNSYPISEESQQTIGSAIDALDVEQSAKQDLHQKLTDLRISGPSAGELKTAVDATGASSDQKSQLKDGIDNIISFEKKALSDIQAIYGNLGLSSDDSTVFVPAFSGYLFALDSKTGFTKWIRDTGGEMVGGVAVDGDTIYWGNKDNKVVAMKADSAEQVWSFETNGEVWATPTIDGSDLYVTSLDGSAYKLDKANGKQYWHFNGAKSGIASRPVVDGSHVYVGSFDSKMYALDIDHGTVELVLRWRQLVLGHPRSERRRRLRCVPRREDVRYRRGQRRAEVGLRHRLTTARDACDRRRWHRRRLAKRRYRHVGPGVRRAVEGSPIVTGTGIHADLAKGDGTTVYILPTSNSLLEFDARAPLSAPGGMPLPQ